MNIIDELTWRGAVNQMTDEAGLRKLTEEKSVSLYCTIIKIRKYYNISTLNSFMKNCWIN